MAAMVLPPRRGTGDWHDARRMGPSVETVNYTDGQEIVWRDRRGRVTRHYLARAGRVGFDVCFKYVREGGRVRRVRISAEEWERRQRPRDVTGRARAPDRAEPERRSAQGFTDSWYQSIIEGRTPEGE